ncbi:MAG: ATP-binding cassette domain-containing protein [Methanoregula sp.]|nr:ATP-binding cassette domain-containing protein [Methanoregula sp.]
MTETPILEVRNLVQDFHINRKFTVKAVSGITFTVGKGEVFGLVGETGSGKSTVARSVIGVNRLTSGKIFFKGSEISDKAVYRQQKADLQKNMQIIFQDSAAALNPQMTVAQIIGEPLEINRLCKTKEELDRIIYENLQQVGLSEIYRDKYPGELSGGQRQRVAIARSIAIHPDLIIADEPIGSLDISIQAQIVTLFQELQKKHRFSFIFIAHDLSIIRFISDRIAVMLKGKIVEMADTQELFENPLHPYTKSLISSVPVPDPRYERVKKIIEYDTSVFTGEGDFKEVSQGHYLLN